MKAKITQVKKGTDVIVVTMPIWVSKLINRKPFEFIRDWVIMDYRWDSQNEKNGLWHLWSAFRAWWKYGRVRG